MLLLHILIACFLFIIAFQDYKFRGISLLLFPVGLVLFSIYSLQYGTWQEQGLLLLINTGVLLIVFVLLTLYMSIKTKRLLNIIDDYIGLGDVLFLYILALNFSPVNYILFITVSLFLILIIYIIAGVVLKPDKSNVPLAGLIAIIYLMFYLLNEAFFQVDPYLDINLVPYCHYE